MRAPLVDKSMGEHHHHHRHQGKRPIRRLLDAAGGHSHAPGGVEAALEASDEGVRAVRLSLIGLAATAVVQLAVVAISGSVALLADSVHNVADALTALPLWVAFRVGRRPPNQRYTYGYGRSEDLAGIFIVAVIAISAVITAWQAVQRLVDPRPVSDLGWVIAAGAVGFVGNELVALYRIRVGRRIGSAALVADGLHARSDGLTSIAVVFGGIGVVAGWEQADPIAGLVITVAILFVLKGAANQVYRRLMDAVDPDLAHRVELVLVDVSGVEAVDAVRVRWIGHHLHAEAEIVSDCDLTVAQAHDIAEECRHRLLHEVPRLANATIHTSPCSHDDRDHHAATAHHFARRDR